jgi:hypothetical protein
LALEGNHPVGEIAAAFEDREAALDRRAVKPDVAAIGQISN